MIPRNVMVGTIICKIITIIYDIGTIKCNIIPIERYHIHTHNKKKMQVL